MLIMRNDARSAGFCSYPSRHSDSSCRIRLFEKRPRTTKTSLKLLPKWVRFGKRTHQSFRHIYDTSLSLTGRCIKKPLRKRWVRFAESYIGPSSTPIARIATTRSISSPLRDRIEVGGICALAKHIGKAPNGSYPHHHTLSSRIIGLRFSLAMSCLLGEADLIHCE